MLWDKPRALHVLLVMSTNLYHSFTTQEKAIAWLDKHYGAGWTIERPKRAAIARELAYAVKGGKRYDLRLIEFFG